MTVGFSGEVATFYAKYRRGYPPAVVDAIVDAFGLDARDVVMDLGCGTGQLSLAVAGRVRTVLGVDPEPDMLALARQAAIGRGVPNAVWMLGADRDLPGLRSLLGDGGIGALTVAVAIHWMERDTLFRAAAPMLRPGGGIAVVTNGAPLWLQDVEWSRILRERLSRWLGRPVTNACQTDAAGRRLNRDALQEAGFRVTESTVEYEAGCTVDELAGGVFSAIAAADLPPPERRAEFVADLRERLTEPMTERVRVTLQFGHVPGR